MQIAHVCSRWWAFKIAKRCGRVYFASFGTETGHSDDKDIMFPAAVLDKRNLKMLCIKRYCWGKVWPELQPRCISPGINLCLFPVYVKKWDQGWTNVFSLLKSFRSIFLMQEFQACALSLPHLSEGCWFSVLYTLLHSVISIPDHARCFSYFLCLYT